MRWQYVWICKTIDNIDKNIGYNFNLTAIKTTKFRFWNFWVADRLEDRYNTRSLSNKFLQSFTPCILVRGKIVLIKIYILPLRNDIFLSLKDNWSGAKLHGFTEGWFRSLLHKESKQERVLIIYIYTSN